MAQNTNFKGNKNNNQKRKLPYIKARIDKLVDVDDCNTQAFASVTVSGAVAILGIRVMNSRKGLFVAMPASNYVDENGETKFSEIVHPISKESRDMLNSKVMEAYHPYTCTDENNSTSCSNTLLWLFVNTT